TTQGNIDTWPTKISAIRSRDTSTGTRERACHRSRNLSAICLRTEIGVADCPRAQPRGHSEQEGMPVDPSIGPICSEQRKLHGRERLQPEDLPAGKQAAKQFPKSVGQGSLCL